MSDRDEMLTKISERNKLAASTKEWLVVMPAKDRDAFLRVARAAGDIVDARTRQAISDDEAATLWPNLENALKELPEGTLD